MTFSENHAKLLEANQAFVQRIKAMQVAIHERLEVMAQPVSPQPASPFSHKLNEVDPELKSKCLTEFPLVDNVLYQDLLFLKA